jgi:HK97 family phage prohead protease
MTFHRALGFVDRSALTADSPLRVVLATEGRKADGIDLRMSGARLERYRGNPVLGYGHNYKGRENLPIGRIDPGSIEVAGKQVAGDLDFDQGDPFAREIERKMRAGYINAVSVGFDVTDWESGSRGVATGWELTETSVVPVPMDADALVTSGRSLDLADPALVDVLSKLSDADFDKVRERMRFLRQVIGPPTVDGIVQIKPNGESERQFVEALRRMVADLPTNTPEPLAPEITPDAARSLLAAFAPIKEH